MTSRGPARSGPPLGLRRDRGRGTVASVRNPTRWAVAAAVVVVVVLALVPLPSPLELRDWAREIGPMAPLAFLVAHAVVTTTPLPRTAFTLAAGLLFGPWLGLGLCVVASSISAVAGFLIARRLGGYAIGRLGPRRVAEVERRLSGRGLLTVTSARLLPALPFAPLNYVFGVTSVRLGPYALGTVVGLVPGTAAVVLLGDAVAGGVTAGMLVIFVGSGALGAVGMVVASRARRDTPPGGPPGPDAGVPGAAG